MIPPFGSLSLLLRPVLPDESLCHATVPAVKGLFSLILAFFISFGSRSTAMLGWERPWKRLREVAGHLSMGHPASLPGALAGVRA